LKVLGKAHASTSRRYWYEIAQIAFMWISVRPKHQSMSLNAVQRVDT
jgi:hypothetical protein